MSTNNQERPLEPGLGALEEALEETCSSGGEAHMHAKGCGCNVEATMHEHVEGCGCGCEDGDDDDDDDGLRGQRQVLWLAGGGLLFVVGLVLLGLGASAWLYWVALLASYLLLGGPVLLKAGRNLTHGRVFDENFLMSVATIGAICLGSVPEAAGVMLFYQVGEALQGLAVRRSRRSISDLMDIRPDFARVLKDSGLVTVAPESVSIGETIIVQPGDRVPLDATVVAGQSALDMTALTGESAPRTVREDDTVLSGSVNLSGVLTLRVTEGFGQSTASKIIELVEHAAQKKAPTERFITRFARYYTPVVVGLAVLIALLPPLLFGLPWIEWIQRALIFLVISCPCALVISIPLGFFAGIGKAARAGILVKGGNYLEALAKLETVVFDKTGTLTRGAFDVVAMHPAPGVSVDGLLQVAAWAEAYSNHPIALSVRRAYGQPIAAERLEAPQEIAGQGVCVLIDGVEALVGNRELLAERGIAVVEAVEGAGTKAYVALGGAFYGSLVVADEAKPDARDAILALKGLGVRQTVMLSGDDAETASETAAALGLDAAWGGLLPHQKIEALERLELEEKGGRGGSRGRGGRLGRLAFVGDGINDAPALARADVGIAMGGLGSDAAIEAADVVLMTDEPSKLAEAVRIARMSQRVVTQNIVFVLVVKALFLLLGALGLISMWEAVFADVGIALLAVLNSMRILRMRLDTAG